VKFVFLR